MAAIPDADRDVTEITPNAGLKMLMVQTRNTADGSDTLTVDLVANGISATGFLWIIGCQHTTDNSVVVTLAPTTSVSAAGVLTITLGAGTNELYTFVICGRSVPNKLT